MLAVVRATPARPLCPSVASATAYATCPWPTVATQATVAACSGAAAYTDMTGRSAAHTADAHRDGAGAQ
jgi:hypothetical protein